MAGLKGACGGKRRKDGSGKGVGNYSKYREAYAKKRSKKK